MKYRVHAMFDKHLIESSSGEVNNLTIQDGRKNQFQSKGLYCEEIFGPVLNFECQCGALRGIQLQGKKCTTCGVLVESSEIRRQNFGHIRTQTYYVNPLLIRPFSMVLGMTVERLVNILSGKFLVDWGTASSHPDWIVGSSAMPVEVEDQIFDLHLMVLESPSIGSETDLRRSGYQLRRLLGEVSPVEYKKRSHGEVTKNYLRFFEQEGLEIVDFLQQIIPISPPSMRPLNSISSGMQDSPETEMYRRILRHSLRIEPFVFEIEHSEDEVRVESCWLALIDETINLQNSIEELYVRGGVRKSLTQSDTEIGSIRNRLSGKSGVIRGNLMGKRVDYSGRSVITTDPSIGINEIGVPRKMAVELYKPFIVRELKETYVLDNVKNGKTKSDYEAFRWAVHEWKEKSLASYDALGRILAKDDAPMILINRAPSLHRYSVMGMKCVIHSGKSIRMSSFTTAGLNADFDGDTISLNLVLSKQANEEVRDKLTPSTNLITSRNGSPMMTLAHEQVVGVYYLTFTPPAGVDDRNLSVYRSSEDALSAYESMRVLDNSLRPYHPIEVRIKGKKSVPTTYGRLLVEEALEIPLGSISSPLNKGDISNVIENLYFDMLSNRLDRVMNEDYSEDERGICSKLTSKIERLGNLGFEWSHQMGLSIATCNLADPPSKAEYLRLGNEFEKLESTTKSDAVRYWSELTEKLEEEFIETQDTFNPLKFMFMTKARVSGTQIRQMTIWKGAIANSSGGMDMIRTSLREGIQPWEYLVSCRGSRQSLGANFFVVPKSGYLGRQLAASCRNQYVRKRTQASSESSSHGIIVDTQDAIGRFDINHILVTKERVRELLASGVESIEILSMLTNPEGISQECVGVDPSTGKITKLGTPVGIRAAQTLSEISTQLALRSKHISGAIQLGEIENCVKAREAGVVTEITSKDNHRTVTIRSDSGNDLTYVFVYYQREDYSELEARTMESQFERVRVSDNLKVGAYFEKDEVIAAYLESLHEKDISGTLVKLIDTLDCENPGSKGTKRGVYATNAGRVKYRLEANKKGDLILYVQVGLGATTVVDAGCIPMVPEGAMVEIGTKLTYGIPNTIQFYLETQDVKATWGVFYRQIKELMGTSGTGLSPVHYECVFRSMLQLDRVHNSDEEELAMMGVKKVNKSGPNFLHNLSYGYVKKCFDDVLVNPDLKITTTPSENIMMGKLTWD